MRAAKASWGGIFFKVWLYFWLALCSRSKHDAILGGFQVFSLFASAILGFRSLVFLGKGPAFPGSKLSQPRSGNILKTLTNMFSPKCSFAIWGRILTKSTYMQENHFPSWLVIFHLPGIRRSLCSAAELFRKTRRVKPVMCCGHRQKFPLPFYLYLKIWAFFTYHTYIEARVQTLSFFLCHH